MAAQELRGAGPKGPASKRLAAFPDEVPLFTLDAIILHVPINDRMKLLTSSLSACRAPSAVNQQQPCIEARVARRAICNAVGIIKVRAVYGLLDHAGMIYSRFVNSISGIGACAFAK